MLIGYARVSTGDQSLDVQLERLKDCAQVFAEKVSGTTDQRLELKACLAFVRKGDVLVITKLDRIARSSEHLFAIVGALREKGVELRVLDQNIDTTTSEGKFLFAVLGAVAEFETNIRATRQREGIERARRQGVHLGRHKALTDTEAGELCAARLSGVLIKDLQQQYGLSKAAVYRYLKAGGCGVEEASAVGV